MKVRDSKYNAVRSGGFDSKREEKRYWQLMKDPQVESVRVHPSFEVFPAFQKCLSCQKIYAVLEGGTKYKSCPACGKPLLSFREIRYVADFLVTYLDGRQEVEDVKGVETETFKVKRKLFERAFPGVTLSIVR